MKRKVMHRRTVLRGLGGIAIGLPFLEAMSPTRAAAQTVAPPKRFVVMYSSNGRVMKNWKPAATGASFPISEILSPLDTPLLRPHLTVVSGIDMASAHKLNGNGHAVGMTNMLTARPFTEVQGTEFGNVGWGAGISIDQEIAKRAKADGQLASIELGVQTHHYTNYYAYMSYGEGGGSGNAIAPDNDPRSAQARLFGNVPDASQTKAELEKIAAQRKSILDFVQGDFQALKGKLGAGDQQRLDKHAELIADLEKRIGIGPYCAKPDVPAFVDDDIYKASKYPDIGKAQMDLLALALSCDITRVGTLQWSTGQSGTVFETWLDADWGSGDHKHHHGISHAAVGSNEPNPTPEQVVALDKLTMIDTWYAEQLAYLGTRLAEIPEADGSSVLDHTAILWVSEVSEGPTHKFTNMPYVLLGGLGGALETGQHFDFGNERSHADLFVTIAHAMGFTDMTTFGDPEFCQGPIDELLVG